jgi:dihydroxyacetone kinase-like protein
VQLDSVHISGLIRTCRAEIASHSDELSLLDSAIGDGDHGTNMLRGFEALFAACTELAGQPLPEALEQIGMTLVMNIGGAAGPLYGTLMIELGRGLKANGDSVSVSFAALLEKAIAAVARRGRSGPGDKTLLDVLYAVHAEVLADAALSGIAARAKNAAWSTKPMQARCGRAAFLGERSIGHVDPGAFSCALLTTAICEYLREYHLQ